jgi:hypothetical protein
MNVQHDSGFIGGIPDRLISGVEIAAIFDRVGNLRGLKPSLAYSRMSSAAFSGSMMEISGTPIKRFGSRAQNSWSQAL